MPAPPAQQTIDSRVVAQAVSPALPRATKVAYTSRPARDVHVPLPGWNRDRRGGSRLELQLAILTERMRHSQNSAHCRKADLEVHPALRSSVPRGCPLYMIND